MFACVCKRGLIRVMPTKSWISADPKECIERALAELRHDENVVSAIRQRRVYVRPTVLSVHGVIGVLAVCGVAWLMGAVGSLIFGGGRFIGLSIAIFVLMCMLAIRIRVALIWVVKVYQRFAPESVRARCRFEPSCSEYMIQSIRKYGVVAGVSKGWCRIKRCSAMEFGVDDP